MRALRFILITLAIVFAGQLLAQSAELSLDNYADQLASLASLNDSLFVEAYQLLDLQLPAMPVRDRRNPEFAVQAELYQEAEQRYFRYQYILGHISARSKLMYETREQLKKLKKEYVKNNPMPYSSDTHSMMSNEAIMRSGQIRQTIAAYDAAIRFAGNYYDAQLKRSKELAESANSQKLFGFILTYNQNVLNKTEPQIRSGILYQGQNELNRGERDAGGISNVEFRAREFALGILLPIFESTKGTKTVDSLPTAVAKILRAISKAKPLR